MPSTDLMQSLSNYSRVGKTSGALAQIKAELGVIHIYEFHFKMSLMKL